MERCLAYSYRIGFYASLKCDNSELKLQNARLWWPNNLGEQNLYDLALEVVVEDKVSDINSNLLFERDEKINVPPNQSVKVMDMPQPENLSSTYFLDLRLMDNEDELIENNFYWLSTVPDIPDFENTTWYWTPNKQHADYTALNIMPTTEIEYTYSVTIDSDVVNFEVQVQNNSDKIALFIEFMLIDKESDEPIVPVFWSDNYISLLPGEKRILTGYADIRQSIGKDGADIQIQGFNIE